MKAALRPRHTVRDYVEIEETSIGVKHEYVAGEIYAMSGGSPEHAALTSALTVLLGTHLLGTRLLGTQLGGGPCRIYSSDLRISIASAEVYTYADLSVVCQPLERDPDSPTHITNPRIVVEVLSPSTQRYDREQKRLYYQQIESLDTYILVAQDHPSVEIWQRNEHDWAHSTYGTGQQAPIPSIQYQLDVDELYEAAGIPISNARR